MSTPYSSEVWRELCCAPGSQGSTSRPRPTWNNARAGVAEDRTKREFQKGGSGLHVTPSHLSLGVSGVCAKREGCFLLVIRWSPPAFRGCHQTGKTLVGPRSHTHACWEPNLSPLSPLLARGLPKMLSHTVSHELLSSGHMKTSAQQSYVKTVVSKAYWGQLSHIQLWNLRQVPLCASVSLPVKRR